MEYKEAKVLVNFYVDKATKNRFDEICRVSGKTRTQVLVALMKDHVLAAKPVLEEQLENLTAMDGLLAKVRRYEEKVNDQTQASAEEMLPAIFWSEDPDPIPNF